MAKLFSVDVLKPVNGSPQTLYLGENAFRELQLIPSNVVQINKQIIARCFLHKIREMDGLTCMSGVRILPDNSLINLDNTPTLPSQLSTRDITKLQVVRVNHVTVDVILTTKKPSVPEDVIKDLLHDICFVNNTLVNLEQNRIAQLYHITAIKLITDLPPDNGSCYQLTNDATISISHTYTTTYLQLMTSNAKAAVIGGVEGLYTRLNKIVRQRNQHILLCGPSGVGKTSLVARLAADLKFPLLTLDCSEIGMRDDLLQNLFDKAVEVCDQDQDNPGALVLLKDVETAGGRQGIKQMHGISMLTAFLEKFNPSDGYISVIATTTKPESVDLSLRRPGRLGQEIFMKVQNESERLEILRCICTSHELSIQNEDLVKIAQSTRGFLASDLALLAKRMLWSDIDDWPSIQKCIDMTIPSGLRLGIGWVNLEKIPWDSIGGMDEIKRKLIRAIEWPIRRMDAFKRLGIKPSKGVLLYGPPGCGKTRLVRAAASNIGATLLSVSGAEVYSPYVGDSEKYILELFRQARLGAPTILFIDEIDTLVSGRDLDGTQNSQSDKVLSAMLTEMDGMGGKEQEGMGSGQVLVVGATNRPGCLDSALTRPGRLDTLLFVGPPDFDTRKQILATYLRRVPHQSAQFNMDALAERTENFSGADIENLVKESVLHQLSKEGLDSKELEVDSIYTVLQTFRPSLPKSMADFEISH